MKHFCIQTNDLNVWRSFLADPEKQWKKGYSAYELAHSWAACEGLPSSIRGVFSNTEFENMKILYVFPDTKCIWIIKRHRLRTIFLC